MEKILLIGTPDGDCHSNNIFGTALVSLLEERQANKPTIIRTSSMVRLRACKYKIDCGGIYDDPMNHWYCSFGIMYKNLGLEFCNNDQGLFVYLEKHLVIPLDAMDTDLNKSKFQMGSDYGVLFLFSDMTMQFNKLPNKINEAALEKFLDLVEVAKGIINRLVQQYSSSPEEKPIFIRETYDRMEDKRLLILETELEDHTLLATFPELLYVIHKKGTDWVLRIVEDNGRARKVFPLDWLKASAHELEEILNIHGIKSVHQNCHMITTISRTAATSLAKVLLTEVKSTKSIVSYYD